MPQLYIGLMSGTSLDGVDAVLADLADSGTTILSAAHADFDADLRKALAELTLPGDDEIDRAGALGNRLAAVYADAARRTLDETGVSAAAVRAIGCHGQTVRHRPERGYTVQIGNAALLAELTGIAVVADFRSRDVAAGGQGAPLVPAFHVRAFSAPREERVVLNLGGIANVTILRREGPPVGFDTGPGNCLLDLWAARHLGQPCDQDGNWAREGKVAAELLERMLAEPYFGAPPPKSTGRELFGLGWLERHLHPGLHPRDVQATLLELTAASATRAIREHAQGTQRVIACGGGTRNPALMQRLAHHLAPLPLDRSDQHGIPAEQVEAAAFAWLAQQAIERRTGNLPSVTGARGPRILGALYPS